MPEWMKQAEAKRELAQAKTDIKEKGRIIAEMKIAQEGPSFWKDLLEKLAIRIEFLPKVHPKIQGRMSRGHGEGGEFFCRLDIGLRDVIPEVRHVNMYYRPGGSVIRYWPDVGKHSDLLFCLTAEKGGSSWMSVRSRTPPNNSQISLFRNWFNE